MEEELSRHGWRAVLHGTENGQGGVGLLVRSPWRVVELEHPTLEQWHDRVIYATILRSDGALLSEVFAIHASEPCILMGDYNEVPGNLDGIDRLTMSGLGMDIMDFACPATQCTPTHVGGRQMDRMVSSGTLHQHVEIQPPVFPMHRALAARIGLARTSVHMMPRIRKVAAFPRRKKIDMDDASTWDQGRQSWREACAQGDLDVMERELSSRWE
eukprot:2331649-Amphidinium_carterae.1